MIYTSYFGNLKKIPTDIICYSIAGKTPAWYDDGSSNHRVCHVLAPKWTWWKEWHSRFADNLESEESRNWYVDKYYETVLKNLNADSLIRMLQDHDTKSICLLCYETPDRFCHRHLVAKWLNDNGIETKEFKNEDLNRNSTNA